MYRYKKPVYSEEQYRRWTEQEKRRHECLEKHTHKVEKKYKVNDLYIFCIQTKYDDCLKGEGKQDSYIISIWEDETRTDLDKCLVHNVYETAEEANKNFKFWIEQCKF